MSQSRGTLAHSGVGNMTIKTSVSPTLALAFQGRRMDEITSARDGIVFPFQKQAVDLCGTLEISLSDSIR